MSQIQNNYPPTSSDTEVERRSVPGAAKDNDAYVDIEQRAEAEAHLRNTTVHNVSWRGINVTVKDRETKQSKLIVDNVEGVVEAGEICALMGPSGSGKTTLLNVLASRPTSAESVEGSVLVNGVRPSRAIFREITCFVEQEDALIGSLTVRETLHFASRLSSSSTLPAKERLTRINALLEAFGLTGQANTLIGTPIRKGISGGQKRRVGVASQLITSPKILFLDEPTSGLDSAASWEVINYLKGVAKRNNLIVIASIHQPSTSTFNLFDKLLLLSAGKPHYFGPVAAVTAHYESLGYAVPLHVNPAEFLLELTNVDFALQQDAARGRLDELQSAWANSPRAQELSTALMDIEAKGSGQTLEVEHPEKKPSSLSLVLTLLHRSFIKAYRDVVAYGIRLAMYTGLALMMGTVWLRLDPEQESIIPLTNAIFYGSAFMSFMAVAYVPAFLEDRSQYVKEHHNGLYGATELVIANFLIGVPFLFLISVVFSAISYWLINLQPTVEAFFTWVMWLFLDLLAAEGLVVFFTSLMPTFVISLAAVAFANGLWMSTNGFMVQPTILNVFYKYAFSTWDYQRYVFEGMMINEFAHRNYDCASQPDGSCYCMYPSELQGECKIAGQAVLDQYGYTEGSMGKHLGIMFGIIVGYRVLAWIVLMIRKN